VVLRLYQTFADGDFDALFQLFDEDVVIDFSRSGFPEPVVDRGHDGARRVWRRWAGAWEEYEATPLEFQPVADKVVVPMRIHARSRGAGIAIDGEFTDVFTVKGGKIVRYAVFADEASARAAAGLG